MSYYHGSNKPLSVSTVIRGRLRHPAWRREAFSRLERMVERRRPARMHSRKSSVFMVARPSCVEVAAGDPMQFVYRVRPSHKPQKHNFGWLEEILWDWTRRRPRLSKEQTNANIDAYWKGRPYRGDVPSFWEYLSPRATVLAAVPKYSPGLQPPRARGRKRRRIPWSQILEEA